VRSAASAVRLEASSVRRPALSSMRTELSLSLLALSATVVMGVDRIQGDSLNFGSVAAAVLRKSKVSVLLVSAGQGENQNGSSRPGSE
jgi:hypothetical protein